MDEAHRQGAGGGTPGTSRLLTSLIGPGVVIRGTIKDSDDTLTIRGRVEGSIENEKRVVIDEQGSIKAEIKAKEIQVRGKVTGNLHGEERVRIAASGNVEGDIQTRRFAVEEGARMKGRVIMTSEMTSEKAPAVKAEPTPLAKAEKTPSSESPSGKGPKQVTQPSDSKVATKSATTRSEK